MFQMYSFLSVPVFLFAAFLIPVAGTLKRNGLPEKIALLAAAINLILFAATLPALSDGKTLTYTLGGWSAPYGITVAIDSMSAVFAAIALLAVFLAVLFSRETVERPGTEYYSLLSLLGAGLLGIIHTADLFNLFVFFEITSISSYALATYGRNAGAFRAAINYLVLGSFGTSLLLLGVAFVYGVTGTLNMADIAVKIGFGIEKNTAVLVAYAMIAAGILLKAAVVPLHAWKPDVLRFATPDIGALFASASATTALYAFLRVSYTVFGFSESAFFHNAVLAAGLATMVLGTLMAFSQKNLMSLLAYSAISQVGYVLVAFGIKNYAAGIFHAMNVAIIELALFLSAGLLVKKTGTSDIKALGLAGANNPVIYWVMLVAFLANAGVPLLSGFASKWMIYVSAAGSAPFVAFLAIAVTVMTFAYSFKAFGAIFSGAKKAGNFEISPAPKAGIYILAGLMVFFGVFYVSGINMADSAVNSLLGQEKFVSATFGG